jgi:hypothetical protein
MSAIFHQITWDRAAPPVHRVAEFVPFVRVVCGEYDRWLRDAILVENKSKQIVPVSFALEAESPLCLLVRGFCPVLRGALLLTSLDHNLSAYPQSCHS